MKLSIIIPAYNEEATVKELLKKVIDAPLSIDKEIIVVNDGSTDKTSEFAKEIPNIIVVDKENGGKGSAIREGLKKVTGELTIIQDADMEYDPVDFQKVINPILEDEADVVYGSRWLNPDNEVQRFDFFFGGKILTWITHFLYPKMKITDEPTCYKCFKTKILRNFNIQSKGFEFCPEVTAKLARSHYRFREVPINYYPRTVAEGKKICWKDGIGAIWTLLKYSDIIGQGIRFAIIGGTGAGIHLGTLYLLTEMFQMWYFLSAMVGIGLGAIWTFTMYRLWAFK